MIRPSIRLKKIILTSLFLAFIISCTVTSSSNSSRWNPIASLIDKLGSKPEFKSLRSNDAQSDLALFWGTCGDGRFESHEIQAHFYSPMGRHHVLIKHEDEHDYFAIVDGREKILIGQHHPIREWHRNYCSQQNQSFVKVANGQSFENDFSKILESFAPDCQFTFESVSGWSCHLPKQNYLSMSENIKSIKRKMLRSSRQPYSLSRRIAFVGQLHRALSLDELQTHRRLDVLCRLISLSNPEEKPLALRGKDIYSGLCKKSKYRLSIAKQVLSYSFAEVQALQKLFRSYSRVGLIQLKIPRDKIPSKDIWVKVIPTDDPASGLKNIKTVLAKANLTVEKNSGCWHPFFQGEKSGVLHIAKSLGLAGNGKAQCNATQSSQSEAERNRVAFRYIYEATSSETEFVVSNGNAKLVRLPKGSYVYALQKHTKLPDHGKSKRDGFSQGDFAWVARRPSVVVKTW